MAGTATGMQYFLGIRGVEFIWNGAYSDPQIKYKRTIFNAWDIQEGLEDMYDEYVKEGYIKPVKGGWQEYYSKHPAEVKAYLDDILFAWSLSKPKRKTATAKKKAPAKKTATKRRA